MNHQTSLRKFLILVTLPAAGLNLDARCANAQATVDTAVDPILRRSKTAAIVFGRIYVADSKRLIFQTGATPDEQDYTKYEFGSNTEVFIDGKPADLADYEFKPGTPATLVPHGENSFMLQQIYVRDPDSTLERPGPPPLPTNVGQAPEPTRGRDSELEVNPVPEVPIGAEFEQGRRGIRIVVIEADGPMSATEFRLGDTIVEVDGKPVLTADSMYRRLHLLQSGDAVELVSLRDDEEIRDELVLPDDFQPAPPQEPVANSNERGPRTDSEPKFAPLIDLGWILVNTSDGVTVYEIEPRGAAAEAGFREGDRITRVGETLVGSARSVYYRLHHFDGGKSVAIGTVRNGELLTRNLLLPEDFEPVYGNDDEDVSGRFDTEGREFEG